DPDHPRLVFTQAPPGLCGCVIVRALVREIADSRARGSVLSSIGGLLGYSPRKPRADAIAKPICVRVDAAVRDAQARFIAEDDAGRALCALATDDTDPSATLASRFAADGPNIAGTRELVLRIDGSSAGQDAEI